MSESDEEEALDYDAIWNDGMEEKLEEIERNELITRRREKYNKIKSISEICEFFWFLLRITRLLGKGSEIDDGTGERMELLTIRGYYKIRSKLEKARPEGYSGAHAPSHNSRSIGICLVGGMAEDGSPENNFTLEQFLLNSGNLEKMIDC